MMVNIVHFCHVAAMKAIFLWIEVHVIKENTTNFTASQLFACQVGLLDFIPTRDFPID